MLTDKQTEEVIRKILLRIDGVNAQYLQKVGEQIKILGKLNPSSVRRLSQMHIYGANSKAIQKALSEALSMGAQEVQELLAQAAEEEYATTIFRSVASGADPIQMADNPQLQKYIEAISRQTAQTMENYSNTTNIDTGYREVVSQAVDAAARGVADYNSAIRDSMRKLGGDGLRVTYESGVTRRMDSAIRQNILDGIRQVSQKAAEIAGEEIGADGVELSAHPFSAIDHEAAQGRQFSKAEFEKMQSGQAFTDVDGKTYDGFKRPIGEWNCHHIASFILLGIAKRRYSDELLEQWRRANHDGCEIDGQHYTVYQASQLMRKLETKIRQQKDIANLAKISGDDVLRREAQAKIRDLKRKYTEVATSAALRERRDRMVVESYRETDKKAKDDFPTEKNSAIMDIKTTGVGERMPNSITASTTQNKLQGYLLNSNHPRGKDKARVMNSVLGYHYENWDVLSGKIYNTLQTSTVSKHTVSEYGDKYTVPMRIHGEKGKSMVLNTAWQVDTGSFVPRLITVTFDKRTIREE